jgi:hypothetical protein
MNIPHPYEEKRFDNGLILREFKHDANVEDLIWHQDKKDRKVFVVESNGWKLQLSDGLPFPLIEGKEYFIPKKSWHRVIKGNGNLKIKIHERDDKVKITESQLRQKVKLLLKEEVYGTIATVYHGSTQPPKEFLKIFETGDGSSYKSTGWEPGKGEGSFYGHGLYSVWMKTNHNTFGGHYGKWIYKLKVNLYGFIIFDEDICKKVYGKSISPLDQLKLLGKEHEFKKLSKKETKELSMLPSGRTGASAEIAQVTSKFLKGRVNGIVFFGLNDGPVVLIYDPDIATPLAWTSLNKSTNEIEPWTTWNASEIKSSLNRSKGVGFQANAERLQTKQEFIQKLINNEIAIIRIYDKLDEEQRQEIATKTINKNILMKLSNDPSTIVRSLVAMNKKTPDEVILKLINDVSFEVRLELLRNQNIKLTMLEKLALDSSAKIRHAVAYRMLGVANNKIVSRILAKLANDPNDDVRARVAQNKAAPVELLAQLANDPEGYVRSWVAGNVNTPPQILKKLSFDPSDRVRNAALNTLQELQSLSELKNLILKLL